MNSKVPTFGAFVYVSVGRRHKLLMTACLRVTVAFLWFRQCSLGRQIAGNVCRQIKFLCKETSVTLKLRQLKSTLRRQLCKCSTLTLAWRTVCTWDPNSSSSFPNILLRVSFYKCDLVCRCSIKCLPNMYRL